MTLDEEKLNQQIQTVLNDFGVTAHAPLVVIGDELGLYETLADTGPLTSAGLAQQSDTEERYVREWLRAQAAGGYVTYDPETDRYSLTPEQASVLADENSPAFMVGNFQVALSAAKIEPQLAEAFRTGECVGYHEHNDRLFDAIAYSWRPQYVANLVDNWIPALSGVDGDHPPTDLEGFVEYAESLPVPGAIRLLEENALVSGDVYRYPFPSSHRRRYEYLDRFPDGLVVVGDAIASLNPIYGQGMSVAALEAVQLHHALATADRDELPVRFFERAAGVLDDAWSLTVGSDFAFPQTTGPKPFGTGLVNRYVGRLLRTAHSDGRLTEAFVRVVNMENRPSSLFRPETAWRVLKPRRYVRRESPPLGPLFTGNRIRLLESTALSWPTHPRIELRPFEHSSSGRILTTTSRLGQCTTNNTHRY